MEKQFNQPRVEKSSEQLKFEKEYNEYTFQPNLNKRKKPFNDPRHPSVGHNQGV
jgi:hypothetical protein